jgi:3-dehydroquinate synthase/2-deoxy-scyllo-inosose synthase
MWQELVTLGDWRFPFICVKDAPSALHQQIAALDPDRIIVVTDSNVGRLHAPWIEEILTSVWPVERLTVEAGEQAKNLATVHRLCEAALRAGATRRSLVIALGGGMVGNLAGLLAGLLFRGVRLLHVPTTLLAASDAVISLKQAVNAHGSKNSFGVYLAPSAVVIHMPCLKTLPEREIRSGLAEVVKNALALAPETAGAVKRLARDRARWSEEHWAEIIRMGVAVKLRVLATDPFERQAGLVFEYGHTVGHAVEWASTQGPRDAALSHGESIAFGMRVAARISERVEIASPALYQQHEELLEEAGLMFDLPPAIELEEVMNIVARDNKRGRIDTGVAECAMVLLHDMGEPAGAQALPLVPVPFDIIREAIADVAVRRSFRAATQSVNAIHL